MSGNSPDSPDPRREFEEQWGRRGTRGIRGGASAKRKRDAWIRFQSEQTGVPPDQIPVVHAGGLSRPLYTPTSWEPVNQLSDSDVEIVAEQVVIHETDLEGVFSLSAPVSREAGSLRPKLLASKPKSRSSSAVAPSTAPAPVAASSSSSRPVPSRAPESGAASSSSSRPIPSRAPVPEPVNPPSSASSSGPSPAVRRLAKLHPSIELYLPNGEQWDRKITEYPIRLAGERIVAFDWHQVSDTFRFNSRSCDRIGDRYELPRGVSQAYQSVDSWKRPGDLRIILSHINNSRHNKEQLLWTIFQNQPAVDLVVITSERCGISGKLYALGALSPYSTTCCLIDDNPEVAHEFHRFNQYYKKSNLEFFHIRVPRKPSVEETGFDSAWNVEQHLPKIREFLERGR